MKIFKEIKILLILALQIINISAFRLQGSDPIQIIQEVHPLVAQVTQVVNRTPIVSTVATQQAPLRVSNVVNFENSNTSTQPNTGIYTKSAIIAPPTLEISKTTAVPVLERTLAHIGNRHETTTITSVSTDPGKEGQIEQHELKSVKPILPGTIDQVKDVYRTDTARVNLETNQVKTETTYSIEGKGFK
jgi:hypothetical protein